MNLVLLLIVKTTTMLHQTGMCHWSTSIFNNLKNVCSCTGHAVVKGNDRWFLHWNTET